MHRHEHQILVERWFDDLFTQGNLDILDELVLPTFVTRHPNGEIGAPNLDAFKTWFRWYTTSFTDTEWIIHDLIMAGNKAIVRYSGQTTYRGG